MKVLAIDSSGLTATVAIVDEQVTIAEYTTNYKKTHSQTLLSMIDEMVKMTELELATIDAIVIAGGPGSFTGLRIGSATAKGLGLALDKPLIHVPTAEGMAYQVYGCLDIICPIMDARRNQVYTGLYTYVSKTDGSEFQVIEEQMALPVPELIQKLNEYGKPVVFLGDGVPVYKELLTEGLQIPYSFAPTFMNRQNAAALGALGIEYYKKGKFESARDHRPDYLRVSQAERERAEREQATELNMYVTTSEEAERIAELEQQTFSIAWSKQAVKEMISNPATICISAEKAGRLVGYMFLYLQFDEIELLRIAVTDDMKRQGIGNQMLVELDKICKNEKVNRVLLEVREGNKAARMFYAKNGFKQDGIRPDYYQKPTEAAILMSRSIGCTSQ